MSHHVSLPVLEILRLHTCMHRDIICKPWLPRWTGMSLWSGEKDQVAAWLFGYEDQTVGHTRVSGEGSTAARQTQSDQVGSVPDTHTHTQMMVVLGS